jgi:DNA-3-methyladenine glycosylase II
MTNVSLPASRGLEGLPDGIIHEVVDTSDPDSAAPMVERIVRDRAGRQSASPPHGATLDRVRSYLRKADPVIARLIDARPDFDPQGWMADLPAMDLFGTLLFQVAGQQLSVAATRRTLGRIEMLFGGRLPSPGELLGVPGEDLREAGLSWRKVATVRDLAERFSDGRLNTEVLSKLPDDEVIAALTTVPGIGPWTAQGALILSLGREDVVLPGDLALRKAIQHAYALDHLPTQAEVLAIAEKWRPYRSVATSYMFSAAFDPPDLPLGGAVEDGLSSDSSSGRIGSASKNEQARNK